ncbi:MAG: DUF5013 domain-containing protein [Paludibacter sp.]|nr:DUF5013 domain-containing protein [Paludibacter sp.]
MMKKLLTISAIAACTVFAKAAEPTDVTAQYLQNYSAPFATTGEQLISGNDRWQKLASPWITEGDQTNQETGVITAWHVDFQKMPNYPSADNSRIGVMTLTPGWDGFSGTFENMKAYQTIKLAPGTYEFTAKRAQDWSGAKNAYLVVAAGTTIPNIADLSTALGSARFETAITPEWLISVNFKLEVETTISVGVIASYTGAQQCVSIAQFGLNFFEGANFRTLNALLAKAKAFTSTQYPIGTIMGTYPQEKWDALQAKIATIETFIAENPNATQEQVDAKVAELQAVIDDLNASLILPFKLSDTNSTTWYQIRDQRSTKNYWQIGEYATEDGLKYYTTALILTQQSDNTLDDQLFKIVKAPAPSKGYIIYCKLIEDLPLAASRKENIVLITDTLPATAWQFGATTSAANFTISLEGDKTAQLNSYASYTPPFVGFYYPGDGVNDYGNNWEFVELIEVGQTDFTALKTLVAEAIRMTSETYPTGTGENQFPQDKWDAFVAARTLALTLVEKESATPQPTQEEVDNMIITLQAAIDELKAAQNPGFFASTEATTHWYTLSDRRTNKSFWKIGALTSSTDTIDNTLIMVKGQPAIITDSLLFKVVKAEEPFMGYYIYNKTNEAKAITGDVASNFIGINDTLPIATWLFDKSTVASHYLISIEGTGDQVNSYAGYAPPYIAFYNGGAGDPGNNWKFTPATPATSVKDVKAQEFRVFVVNRMVISDDTDLQLTVYNINGQKMDAKHQLAQGIYIVRAEGKSSAVKVIVR